MFYAGDEVYGDEITSGPYDPERDDAAHERRCTGCNGVLLYREAHHTVGNCPGFAIDAERQASEDEYDREQSR